MDHPTRYYINACAICNDMHICNCLSEDSDYGFFLDIDEDLVAVPVKHPNGFSVRSVMKKYIHKNGITFKERRNGRQYNRRDMKERPVKYAIYPDDIHIPDKKINDYQTMNLFDELPISLSQLSFGCIYAAILFVVLF